MSLSVGDRPLAESLVQIMSVRYTFSRCSARGEINGLPNQERISREDALGERKIALA